MTLTWHHTVIGGQTAPYDYSTTDGDTPVGRITRVEHGPAAGEWMWSVYAKVVVGRDVVTHGREPSKQAAADRVRALYLAASAALRK